MKFMKKAMAFGIACVMGLTLAGCGSSTGNDSITVYSRDASSGTREAFEKANDMEEMLTDAAVTVDSNGDMATKVGADPNGIGYVSLSTDFEANNLTALNYEGVAPSKETVLDGTYGMQRPFSYVTRASGDFADDRTEQLVAAFIDYLCNSTEGMQVVADAGGIVDTTKSTPWEELKANHPIVDEDNSDLTIRTAGSTSVTDTLQAALESFQSMAGNFQFTMNQTGSGDGYKRVLGEEKDGANAADIGFASREFEGEEDVTQGMASGQYCIDAVVAVISADNTFGITDLTADQIKGIFSGEITAWGDLQ